MSSKNSKLNMHSISSLVILKPKSTSSIGFTYNPLTQNIDVFCDDNQYSAHVHHNQGTTMHLQAEFQKNIEIASKTIEENHLYASISLFAIFHNPPTITHFSVTETSIQLHTPENIVPVRNKFSTSLMDLIDSLYQFHGPFPATLKPQIQKM